MSGQRWRIELRSPQKGYAIRCTISADISQPCIYIISYSVEFVKRFLTLFLFFFCAVLILCFC